MPGPFYFAWAGGTITEQQTVITSGNLHGGRIETVTIVGDVTAGSPALTNVASFSGLSVGTLYRITGPGVPSAWFLYDTSALAAAGSINMSTGADANVTSGTYTATKSISVAAVAGTLSAGSETVDLGAVDLPAGIYSIYGPGIGETLAPGGGLMAVSTALFIYDGTSGVADMFVYALPDGAPQVVVATATGVFPLGVNGMPDSDWYNVTAIPPGALASLITGLRYNISGNGLQSGTTFVADSGATSITLDLPSSATAIAAVLTITGPRTPNADFDAETHAREDEQIVGLEIAQEEGGFATLTIEIKNPNIGLLAFGRNLWCWLSWDSGWTPGAVEPVNLIPLFNGRLIGVPRLQAGEIITLEFLARPDDYNAQRAAVVSGLAVLPFFDPVWRAEADNPDTVLETYSSLWHIDRTSLGVSVSDILQGEAGIISIGEDASLYDAFSLSYGTPPLTAVQVSGTVSWDQQATGSINITRSIVAGFSAAGSPYGGGGDDGGLISCTCGDGLRTSWPAPGTNIGGGWSLSTDNEGNGKPLCYCISATAPEGWLEPNSLYVGYASQAPLKGDTLPNLDKIYIEQTTEYYGLVTARFPINIYKIRMVLDWRATRRRTETVTAVITANVQRELSDSAESDLETVSLTSQYVSQGVDDGGQIPLGTASRRTYFQTTRGARSFEYLLLLARAKLRARARSVDVSFAIPWAAALNITLRHSVTLLDRRLPGGACTGKVKSYRLTVRGGTMRGDFTIGCSIGNDEAATAAAGEPSYVDEDYVGLGYQVIAGGEQMAVDGELAYQTLDNFVIADDGLDLTNLTREAAVQSFVVFNGLSTQLNTLASYNNTVAPTNGDPISKMKQMITSCTLTMRPVTGTSFHTQFYPAVSQLWLPKTIDLAAPSG